MNTKSPYEQLRFINDVIKDRKEKNQSTFFSVKLETFGKETPLVDKETGDTFYETILQYLTRYDINSILIELYHGKAHNIKEPFQSFRIPFKRSSDTSLGSIEKVDKNDLTITPAESVVSTDKHLSSLFDKERQILQLDYEVRMLKTENEELKRKNKKKKDYILELETEFENGEKSKKKSLANVSLGAVAANAMETFAKSPLGLGILKNVFGANQNTLNGLLGIDENSTQNNEHEQNSSASIIIKSNTQSPKQEPKTEEEKIRAGVIKYITDFINGADNNVLRLYYELVQLMGKDLERLQQVYVAVKYAEQSKTQKTSSTSSTVKTDGTKKEEHLETEEEEEETDDDPDLKDTS